MAKGVTDLTEEAERRDAGDLAVAASGTDSADPDDPSRVVTSDPVTRQVQDLTSSFLTSKIHR